MIGSTMRRALGAAPAFAIALTIATGADAAQFYKVGEKNLPKLEKEAPTPSAESEAPTTPVSARDVLAKQRELVAEQIDGLEDERRGKTDLYAVLVAGHPYQRVFMREIEQIGGILDRRFDIGDRIAKLANSARDPARYPLATAENLSLVLKGVAREMNPMEDVLFLYLTSHGAPGRLDASFREMATADISARDLSRALDEAGIRQAVIVVSACHSGSFLPHLNRPGYVAMAASAADRNSFGCSDANEWTWFGRALFTVGFDGTPDIRAAFDEARGWVATEEKAKGFEPSEPQIQVGAEAWRYLDRLANPNAR